MNAIHKCVATVVAGVFPAALCGCRSPQPAGFQAQREAAEIHTAALRREVQQDGRVLYTVDEAALKARLRLALRQAVAAGRQAAEADASRRLAREREEADRRLEQAVRRAREDGRAEGEKQALHAWSARHASARPAPAAREVSARPGTTDFRAVAGRVPLLDRHRLRDDTARTMPARHLLELVGMRVKEQGYRLLVTVPAEAMKRIDEYDRGKVSLSFSPEFNAKLTDHFSRMTLGDGLALLFKLYGFTTWVSSSERIVWLGFATAPPPGSVLELRLHFDERRFL